MNITPDLFKKIYAMANGALAHVNNGSCPDAMEGPVPRDSDCPACKAYDEARNHWVASGGDIAELDELFPQLK